MVHSKTPCSLSLSWHRHRPEYGVTLITWLIMFTLTGYEWTWWMDCRPSMNDHVQAFVYHDSSIPYRVMYGAGRKYWYVTVHNSSRYTNFLLTLTVPYRAGGMLVSRFYQNVNAQITCRPTVLQKCKHLCF